LVRFLLQNGFLDTDISKTALESAYAFPANSSYSPFKKISRPKTAFRAALYTILVGSLLQNGFLDTDIGKTVLRLGSFFQ
jgi:hypothetical protein